MAVLTARALNRSTLERQLLLRRTNLAPLKVIERLVGVQAQDPHLPYLGLWTRTAVFDKDDLTRLLYERKVVRSTLYRGTQHIVSTEDYLWLRPTLQPMLDRWQKASFGKVTSEIDLAELTAAVRGLLLANESLTRRQLAKALAERWPDRDSMGLAWSAQGLLAMVHPPPHGTWGQRGPTPFTLAESWLGRPLAKRASPEKMIQRYLAGFGPATVKDMQAWCGMTRMREVVERLRPKLRVFRNEDGAELFDIADAPLPDPDAPAPTRFLPELDNVVIAFDDRRRMMTEEQRRHVVVEAPVTVDGFLCGFWRITRDLRTAILSVDLTGSLSTVDRAEVAAEGERLLQFAAADADDHDIQFRTFGAEAR